MSLITLKINTQSYPNIWFTSDWHVNHDKEFLYSHRGCFSREHHSFWLKEKINKLAGIDDLIISLGDVCLTSTVEELAFWFTGIKCRNIWSITGNHEGTFLRLIKQLNSEESVNDEILRLKMSGKDIRNLGQYLELTIIEPSIIPNRKDKRYPITLCHFPMLLWNNSHHGAYNLCGHSHGSLKESAPLNGVARRLDCGVESAIKLFGREKVMFKWEDIKTLLEEIRVVPIDHHNETTG